MGSSTRSFSLLLVGLIWVALICPVHGFGAGYVARGSANKGLNFRHGDILSAVYFLRHTHLTIVRQIYFGNWLRDFSQIIDQKSIELVPLPIMRSLVAVFAFMQFGYSTQEFEVTEERLGAYRPEEHIDNPKGYVGGRYPQLRPQVEAAEHDIDRTSAMKNYIANQEFNGVNDTSLDFIEKQLIAAIACGRARDAEAYLHLGAALHTLEDFMAHSNWIELCMQMLGMELTSTGDTQGSGNPETASLFKGMVDVFTFTGDAAKIKTHRGLASPIVTGTFGNLDLYQTLLGEVDDKVSGMNIPGVQQRTSGDDDGSLSTLSKHLITMFNGFGDNDFAGDITRLKDPGTSKPADWGRLTESPDLLWEALEPFFRLRDRIVRWVYDHLTVNAVANGIAAISIALDKLVYRALGIFLAPVLKDISVALQHQSRELLLQDQEVGRATGMRSIFDPASTVTDPTHSQLCKDHYDDELNELAGRVATVITTFTIKKVVELWQPGSLIEVKPAMTEILAALHHPWNYSKDSEIQVLMVSEVLNWCTSKQKLNPQAFEALLQRLSRSHVAAVHTERVESLAHSHVPAMTATYAGPEQIQSTTTHDLVTVDAERPHVGFMDKLGNNIEKSLKKGGFPGLSLDDLPGIKQMLSSIPSASTPNPIDQALTRFPGQGLLPIFEDIDMNEIAAAPGMGVVLKDAVIGMRLKDVDWVEKEQLAARETLGSLKDRPVKEMLDLLDIKPVEKTQERPGASEESKIRRIIKKVKAL